MVPLLVFWAGMLESGTPLGNRIAGLYDHVLVDEYQDTNLLQARLLLGMARQHQNITVVGDDAQSIYAFRGATIRNILDFPRQFAGAQVVTLEVPVILDDKRRYVLLPGARSRPEKRADLFDAALDRFKEAIAKYKDSVAKAESA